MQPLHALSHVEEAPPFFGLGEEVAVSRQPCCGSVARVSDKGVARPVAWLVDAKELRPGLVGAPSRLS